MPGGDHRQAGSAGRVPRPRDAPPRAASCTSRSPRLRSRGIDPGAATAAVQGFGKVGRTPRGSWPRPAPASSPSPTSTAPSRAAAGLDIAALEAHVDAHRLGGRLRRRSTRSSHDDLLSSTSTCSCRPRSRARSTRATPIGFERARRRRGRQRARRRPRPTRSCESAGRLVVPDILANAGGVIVSYFEWVQANQAYWWSEDEVEARLADRMARAWDARDRPRRGRSAYRCAPPRPASRSNASPRPTN